MTGSDLAAVYQSKAIEYLIAVAYLVLFVPFWRYLGATPAIGRAEAPAVAPEAWFSVPSHVSIHPGHAWAAPSGATVLVGLDDFAQKLIGPMKAIHLPNPGDLLLQGEKGWTVLADGRDLDVLSPVNGIVVAANAEVAAHPDRMTGDPYGRGWLLRVRALDWARSARQLLSGSAARRLMEDAADRLRTRLSPELGLVLQDGGRPVHGIARELAPEDWDALAREFLLTDLRG